MPTMSDNLEKLIPVANRLDNGKLKWRSWRELPSLQHYKKLYKKKPERFTEIDGTLFLKDIDPKVNIVLHKSLLSAIQLAGSRYALALALANGDRTSKEFQAIYKNLSNATFRDKLEWLNKLQGYIKTNALKVGVIDENRISWFEQPDFGLKVKTIKVYYSEKPQYFTEIDGFLYFLPPHNVLLENMFFRCVELAGSEHTLAKELANGDVKEFRRHIKNFERFNFKKEENFKLYSELFSIYLDRHRTLFDEEPIYA